MSATGDPLRADSGATLIEMLVVIGIMALVAGLVFPPVQAGMERSRLEHARAGLVADLRLARASALREGHEVRIDLAPDGSRYGWGQRAVVLPPGVRASADRETLKFYADGSSSGGDLKLAARARALAVRVDPVTGVAAPAGVVPSGGG